MLGVADAGGHRPVLRLQAAELARLLDAQGRVAHDDDQLPVLQRRQEVLAVGLERGLEPFAGQQPAGHAELGRQFAVDAAETGDEPDGRVPAGQDLAGPAGRRRAQPGTPSLSGTITDTSPLSISLPPCSVTSTCVHRPAL